MMSKIKNNKRRYKAKEETPIQLDNGAYHTMEGLMFKYNASTSHISRVVMDNKLEKRTLLGKTVYKDDPELYTKREPVRHFEKVNKKEKADDGATLQAVRPHLMNIEARLASVLLELDKVNTKLDSLGGSFGHVFKSLKVLKDNGAATDENIHAVTNIMLPELAQSLNAIAEKAIERGKASADQMEKLIELLMEWMTLPSDEEPREIIKKLLEESRQKQTVKEFNARLIKKDKGDGVSPA
jgi:hypothetical protein